MRALDGQVAIVTGGGSGIGREAAIGLSREGARVVVAGRRVDALHETVAMIEAAGGAGMARSTDLADPDDARGLITWTEDELGRVDVLVNNAGTNTEARAMRRYTTETWDAVFAVNVTAPMVAAQAALPGMIERGGGTIVTVSSMAAVNPSPMAGSAYSASKAAVANLMRHINNELRARGIRACTIYPGEAATDLLDLRVLAPDEAARATMMGAEDVAAAIVFCATMPTRTMVEEIYMRPTRRRDLTADNEAAINQ